MLSQPLAVDTAPALAMIELVARVLLQLVSAVPPTQTPSFDLSSYLLSILTIAGTIITVLGLFVSIYFFYRTLGMSVKIQTKPESSIDSAILVLDVYRCPLDKKLWEKYRRQSREAVMQVRLLSIILRVMSIVIALGFLLLNYFIYISPPLPSFIISPRAQLFAQVSSLLLFVAYFYLSLQFTKRLPRLNERLRKLKISPEKASWWFMDHAEMAVYAEYNYLLLKAHWALKQIRAEVIAVKCDSVEGIVVSGSTFRVLKATIKADQDEKDTFIISVEIPDVFVLGGQLTKGEYINRFLDLMVSGGLDTTNQKLPFP